MFGKQFGYGNVEISTAGGAGVELSFDSVSDPKAVQERINARVKHDDGSDQEGKAAVLDEILTELRALRAAAEQADTAAVEQADTAAVEQEDTAETAVDARRRPDDP